MKTKNAPTPEQEVGAIRGERKLSVMSLSPNGLSELLAAQQDALTQAIERSILEDFPRRARGAFVPAAGSSWYDPVAERVFEPPAPVELAEAPNGPSKAYLATARKIGVRSVPILEWELDEVLREEHIRVYDYAAVERYLSQQVRKLSKENPWGDHGWWTWKPLRQCDVVDDPGVRGRMGVVCEVYSQAIPEAAFMVIADTVEKVTQRVPEAKFYVTEITSFPDPFAGVTVPGSKNMRVFERWNEPGFRST